MGRIQSQVFSRFPLQRRAFLSRDQCFAIQLVFSVCFQSRFFCSDSTTDLVELFPSPPGIHCDSAKPVLLLEDGLPFDGDLKCTPKFGCEVHFSSGRASHNLSPSPAPHHPFLICSSLLCSLTSIFPKCIFLFYLLHLTLAIRVSRFFLVYVVAVRRDFVASVS